MTETAATWDDRFGGTDYLYGTEPNEFLRDQAHRIPPGPVLCLGEGEGRNAVYLAALGHAVTAVDGSAVGLDKARRLAAERGVSIETRQADLAEFEIEPGAWAGVVNVFCHMPSSLRARVHAAAVAGLRPGGVFLLEGYTPEQLQYGTGGPKNTDMLWTPEDLRRDLDGLRLELFEARVREVREGSKHTGAAAVLQIVGVKDPA